MYSRLFTLEQAAERLNIPKNALRKAVMRDYLPGEDQLPRLAAKRGRARGRGYELLIPESALADFIDQLPDA